MGRVHPERSEGESRGFLDDGRIAVVVRVGRPIGEFPEGRAGEPEDGERSVEIVRRVELLLRRLRQDLVHRSHEDDLAGRRVHSAPVRQTGQPGEVGPLRVEAQSQRDIGGGYPLRSWFDGLVRERQELPADLLRLPKIDLEAELRVVGAQGPDDVDADHERLLGSVPVLVEEPGVDAPDVDLGRHGEAAHLRVVGRGERVRIAQDARRRRGVDDDVDPLHGRAGGRHDRHQVGGDIAIRVIRLVGSVVELVRPGEGTDDRLAEGPMVDAADGDRIGGARSQSAQAILPGRRGRGVEKKLERPRDRRDGVVVRVREIARRDIDPAQGMHEIGARDRPVNRTGARSDVHDGVQERQHADVVLVR